MLHFSRVFCLFAGCVCLGCSIILGQGAAPVAHSGSAAKSALLIGIDTYEPKGTHPHPPAGVKLEGRFAAGLDFENLEGPVNDVKAMRAMLTSPRFGFPNDDQHIHILMDEKATRANILAAMDTYVANAAPGSTVVFYIASHGSLRINDQGAGQVYLLDGDQHKLDGTLVPADAYLGAEDITSFELRTVLMKAAKRGVHVTAIFDSCHSGGQARGAELKLVKRSLAWDPRPITDQPATYKADGSPTEGPQDLPENPVLVFSAAQKDQSALEDQSTSTPHGLFTTALIQALDSLPAGAKASDVFARVQVNMELAGASNQQPALDTTPTRKRQPLFGGASENGPVRASVIQADDTGIQLNIGKLQDIGTGSEFKDITSGNNAILRIKDYEGIERSDAIVISPTGFTPKNGDLLERTKWVPAERPALYFYAGLTNLTKSQLDSAAAAVTASQVILVKDPSADAWTNILFWNGTNWLLQPHSHQGITAKDTKPTPIQLGATLDAATLKKNLPAGAVLWFNAPLASGMAAMPDLNSSDKAAKLTDDRTKSQYVLVGNLTSSSLQYAWYSRGELDSDVQTPRGFGTGCSPSSPYPLRTNWVAASVSDPTHSDSLSHSATQLAKLHMWLSMPANSSDASKFDYSLGLQPVNTTDVLASGGHTFKGQRYNLVLTAPQVPTLPAHRWVYVLGITCQGDGELLWPRSGPGGSFPTENDQLSTIVLPGLTFRIAPPYGTDTYILLTTSNALPEPDILNFEGAVRGGSRGLESPLEALLQQASQGTRGVSVATPTDWGVDILQTQSQPDAAPPATH